MRADEVEESHRADKADEYGIFHDKENCTHPVLLKGKTVTVELPVLARFCGPTPQARNSILFPETMFEREDAPPRVRKKE